ncbi:MAG: hypothetical protein RRZ24_04975 [Clostridia bacterium]
MKIMKTAKNIGLTISLPVLTYVFFLFLTNATGHPGFGVGEDLKTIIYGAVYATLIAQAMSINLQTGRFDFAMGATLVLSVLVGGLLTERFQFGPIVMLLTIMIMGVLIGLVSGVVYVSLSLPPMVISIGLAMIYEAIGFILTDQGVNLIGRTDLLIFARFPNNLILMGIVLVVLVIVYDYTKIGYNRKALRGGQKIAVDIGINEKKNAVWCYAIAGALLALAAVVYLSKFGKVGPAIGLSSVSYFMSAFLPMFIGAIFARYTSQPIAIFMGGIVQATLDSGLARMDVSTSVNTVINGLIVCVFLIYSSNAYKIVEIEMFRQKLKRAEAARTNAIE